MVKITTSVPTSLGGIIGTAGSSLSVLAYLPYILIVVILGFLIWAVMGRRKHGALYGTAKTVSNDTPRNRAFIISLKHNASFGIHPFFVRRIYDAEKNVEEARAMFPEPHATNRFGDIKKYFKSIVTRTPVAPTSKQVEDNGVAFNEAICLRNELGGWDTIYTLEENLQLPMILGLELKGDKDIIKKIENWVKSEKDKAVTEEEKQKLDNFYKDVLETFNKKATQLPFVTDDNKVKEQIVDLTRATEKRVSRLKQLLLGMQNFVGTNTQPQQTPLIMGMAAMIILLVLVLIGYSYGSQIVGSLNSVAHEMANVTANLKMLHNVTITSP